MSDLTRWVGPGREGFNDLAAWADHRRRLLQQDAIAARTAAEIDSASAVWDASRHFPDNPTVAWLRSRYAR
ncbi:MULTISPECIES: hypothetical protein [unclassified Rathayibacter]|uniref:hypothetical protein n=1 Tax=unclassified Rathayibacter TaxID=2609250 RepID=UPI0011B0276D|nr:MULTISPECIES: hypothetical protein [unclassified Rathayibacter]